MPLCTFSATAQAVRMLFPGLAAGMRGDEWRIYAEAPNAFRTAGRLQRLGLSRHYLNEEVLIIFEVPMKLLREVFLVEDRFLRTSRHTSAAVDTFVRLNVERSCTFVDAVHRALFDTRAMDAVDTCFSNYVSHDALPISFQH